MPIDHVVPVFSRRQKVILGILLVVSVTATALVLFGPGRGAREDIAHVRADLHATRAGVDRTASISHRTLDELSQQLRATQQSLEIQQQGLDVAKHSQRISGSAERATETIRRQTADALVTTRRVLSALEPLRELHGDVTSVTRGVQAGVSLARTTLAVGRETLRDGEQALAVAVTTLDTLRRSEQVQRQLLEVGRQTLQQVSQINRKIPSPAVFGTSGPVPDVTP